MIRCVALLTLLCIACSATAAEPPATPVQLPYILRDDTNSTWDVQYDGSIGDGGNDLYDGGGRLFLGNNVQYQSQGQGLLNASKNEIILPASPINGVNVSRRIAVFPALSTIRFTEIFENPTPAPVKMRVRAYFNMGGTVQQAIPLVDEKRNRQAVGYAMGDQNNAVAMIGAGRGSKVIPQVNYRYNDDNVDLIYDVDIPAKQTTVLVHFQLRRRSADAAATAWQEVKEKELLKDLPKELRRRVVNFPGSDAFIGDLEILRGDALDVVELKGGDLYRGTLKLDTFKLQTLYGPVTLPVEKVVAFINVGTYKSTQLLVTAEGEVFGGRLDINAVKLQLTSGQITTIPLSQITRLGYRKRPVELEEWNPDKPTAYLRTGERVRIKMPSTDFNLATTSGPIRLNPSFISSIVLQGEDNNVPEVHLTDGSKISALLGKSQFDSVLTGLGAEQHVQLPAAATMKFTFAPQQETDHLTPNFTLVNNDQLIGTLGGSLSVETPFDTLHVEGQQIKAMTHTKTGDHDVKIVLWDDAVVSGRLVDSHLTCQLKCGVVIKLPIALLDEYNQPLPTPSPSMINQIKQIVKDLDSDDWHKRDAAQRQIMTIGPCAMAVLKQVQPAAPAEAAQRIDLILYKLTKQIEHALNPQSAMMNDYEGDGPVDPAPIFNGPIDGPMLNLGIDR